MTTENRVALANGEVKLWQGKPKKGAFIAQKSLTMLPFAIVWFLFDFNAIRSAVMSGDMLWVIIPFFALHLMPVWIWLANVITAYRRWQNTNYYITNRRIIIQGGFFAVNETSLFYKDLRNTQLKIGFLDNLFHTGDIIFDDGHMNIDSEQKKKGYAFEDLENPQQVYQRVQKIILDIQTDMEYPNALRPGENPGYHTEYRS